MAHDLSSSATATSSSEARTGLFEEGGWVSVNSFSDAKFIKQRGAPATFPSIKCLSEVIAYVSRLNHQICLIYQTAAAISSSDSTSDATTSSLVHHWAPPLDHAETLPDY
jgi:hypothetical protein